MNPAGMDKNTENWTLMVFFPQTENHETNYDFHKVSLLR